MKKIYIFLLVMPLLYSCAVAAPAPAPQKNTPSVYDGRWQGTGLTSDGESFVVSFMVEHGFVKGIQYQYKNPSGVPCFNSHYFILPKEQQIQIKDDTFNADLGADMNFTAKFNSSSSASGHLLADIYYRYETCNGKYELIWSAQKQAAQIQPEKTPVPKSNPLEIFFQILVFGLSNGAALALNAIAVTIIYSTVRSLNLAHGDVFALGTVFVTSLINLLRIQPNWNTSRITIYLLIVFLCVIIFGALLSILVNQLGFKPFRNRSRLAPLIATLGLSFVFYQVALVWRVFQSSWIPGEHRSVPGLPEVPTDGIPNFLPEINLVKTFQLPFNVVFRLSDLLVLVMAILFVALVTWFLQKTSAGKALRALVQNPSLAEMVGVNINATINRAFAIGGALAGAAAFIFALYYGRPFGSHGAQSGLIAFTAALLGGIGNPLGALGSSLFIGVFSSLSDYYLSAQWTNAILFFTLIILITWRARVFNDDINQIRDSVMLAQASSWIKERRSALTLLAALTLFPVALYLLGWGGQTILRSMAIFIMLAFGLNIVLGLAGLLDFGFAASYGLGAYAAALILRAHGSFSLAILVGVLIAGLLGVVKGLLSYRLRGDFLAVATLALGLLIRQLIINLEFTGGVNGFSGLPAPRFPFWLAPTLNYYLVLVFVFFGAWLSMRLTSSHIGRVWLASSEDELAALSSGVNVACARMSAFVTGSCIAGLAGALYAGTFTYVDPDLFAFHVTTMVLTMVILGGAGSVSGVILGTVLIIGYDKVILPQFGALVTSLFPNMPVGSVPNLRGVSFLTFGLALYFTVLWRTRKKP